jgi:hypothetical protein
MVDFLAELRASKDGRHADPDADLEAALKRPIQLNIDELSLLDTVKKIAAQTGIEIWLDQRSLADAAIDPTVLVTFQNRTPLALSAALNVMLEEFELTYDVRHGRVAIISKEKADDIGMWRAYPVDDLLGAADAQEPKFGPLIQLIEDEIAPASWGTNGGPGPIRTFTAPWGKLIFFRNSRLVHELVAALLADLRAVKQSIRGVEPAVVDPTARHTVAYDLKDVSGPEAVKVITEAVAPDTWLATPRVDEAKSSAQDAAAKPSPQHWRLIVSQTADVHKKLGEFISTLTGGVRRSSGMSGGMMGGSVQLSPNR